MVPISIISDSHKVIGLYLDSLGFRKGDWLWLTSLPHKDTHDDLMQSCIIESFSSSAKIVNNFPNHNLPLLPCGMRKAQISLYKETRGEKKLNKTTTKLLYVHYFRTPSAKVLLLKDAMAVCSQQCRTGGCLQKVMFEYN